MQRSPVRLWFIIRINDFVFAPISRTELPSDQGIFYVNEVTWGTHLKNRTGCQWSQSMVRGLKLSVLPPDCPARREGLEVESVANWLSQSWPHNEASMKPQRTVPCPFLGELPSWKTRMLSTMMSPKLHKDRISLRFIQDLASVSLHWLLDPYP